MQETERNMGLIPGSGRSPGGGHGNPIQYPCLENPMDGGVWWATVHRVAKSWTWLKQPTHTHARTHTHWTVKGSILQTLIENISFIAYAFWLFCAACGILVLWPGIEHGPRQWKHEVLTIGLPGNSPKCTFKRRRGRGVQDGRHMYTWLIHVNVWQKPQQYYKVISFQLNKLIFKKEVLDAVKK